MKKIESVLSVANQLERKWPKPPVISEHFREVAESLANVVGQAWTVNAALFEPGRMVAQRIAEIAEPFQRHTAFLHVIDCAGWPIQFSASKELVETLASFELGSDMDDEALREVDSLVIAAYSTDVLNARFQEWCDGDLLDEGYKSILRLALEDYFEGKYVSCCAILMCLLEGFIDALFALCEEAGEVDVEVVQLLRDIRGEDYRVPKRLKTAKDKLFASAVIPEGAILYWQSAINYVADVTLANKADPALMARNPLRNKICHGAQTNYDTQIHALKAILVTDFLIYFLRVADEALEDGALESKR